MFTQNCQQTNANDAHNAAASFAKFSGVDILAPWYMATLAERVEHALKTRGMKPRDLDLALAERLGKKKTSASGYVHRVIKKWQDPAGSVIAAMAAILNVSERWLLTGQGPMDREEGSVPTYDSLTGWAEAAEAEIARGRTQAYAIHAAGRSPAFVRPEQITPDFVLQCALFWLSHAKEEDRQAAMKAEAARLKAIEDARRSKR